MTMIITISNIHQYHTLNQLEHRKGRNRSWNRTTSDRSYWERQRLTFLPLSSSKRRNKGRLCWPTKQRQLLHKGRKHTKGQEVILRIWIWIIPSVTITIILSISIIEISHPEIDHRLKKHCVVSGIRKRWIRNIHWDRIFVLIAMTDQYNINITYYDHNIHEYLFIN